MLYFQNFRIDSFIFYFFIFQLIKYLALLPVENNKYTKINNSSNIYIRKLPYQETDEEKIESCYLRLNNYTLRLKFEYLFTDTKKFQECHRKRLSKKYFKFYQYSIILYECPDNIQECVYDYSSKNMIISNETSIKNDIIQSTFKEISKKGEIERFPLEIMNLVNNDKILKKYYNTILKLYKQLYIKSNNINYKNVLRKLQDQVIKFKNKCKYPSSPYYVPFECKTAHENYCGKGGFMNYTYKPEQYKTIDELVEYIGYNVSVAQRVYMKKDLIRYLYLTPEQKTIVEQYKVHGQFYNVWDGKPYCEFPMHTWLPPLKYEDGSYNYNIVIPYFIRLFDDPNAVYQMLPMYWSVCNWDNYTYYRCDTQSCPTWFTIYKKENGSDVIVDRYALFHVFDAMMCFPCTSNQCRFCTGFWDGTQPNCIVCKNKNYMPNKISGKMKCLDVGTCINYKMYYNDTVECLL